MLVIFFAGVHLPDRSLSGYRFCQGMHNSVNKKGDLLSKYKTNWWCWIVLKYYSGVHSCVVKSYLWCVD